MRGGKFLGHLEAHASGLRTTRLELCVEPFRHGAVEEAVARDPDEQAAGAPLRGERERGADHPAIDDPQQVVAFGGRHEFRRQHLAALRVEHADQQVEHLQVVALQAGDRLLDQPEPVLQQRGTDVLDPDLIIGLDTRIRVGAIDQAGLVAAALPCLPARIHRVVDRRREIRVAVRDHAETDAAGERHALAADVELVAAHPLDELFGPGVGVVPVAPLEQHQEADAAEASSQILRQQMGLQQ